MITERGSIKVTTPITEGTQRELNKSSRTLSILYMVLGPVFLVVGIAFLVLLPENPSGDGFCIFGLILLVMGIFLWLLVNKTVKSSNGYQKVEEVEFFVDHMMVREYTDGELTTTSKVYYKWVVKVKETANYLFLYNTRVTGVAIGKSALPLQELNVVRNLIKQSKNTATVQPQRFNGGASGGVNGGAQGGSASAVADPFGDFAAAEKAEGAAKNEEANEPLNETADGNYTQNNSDDN